MHIKYLDLCHRSKYLVKNTPSVQNMWNKKPMSKISNTVTGSSDHAPGAVSPILHA